LDTSIEPAPKGKGERDIPMTKTKNRFDQLLRAMTTQPVPLEKPAKEARTSSRVASAGYGDTRTREGKAASASSKPKRKSR
jgi:hypothetical protein